MDSSIVLRKSVVGDLEFFFKFQLDTEANLLAAFTSKDPSDRPAYFKR